MTNPESVWLNEDLIPLSQARVSVEDRGFLYGDGLFETIRAEDGRALFLLEHLERLEHSAKSFRLPFPPEFPWEARLRRLLAANGLERGVARIKIQLTRGVAEGLGLPQASAPTLVMWAKPYTPPTPEEYVAGWPVATFPQGRTTPVGRHKSLNYLFYLAARQYALDRDAKEAIILEVDGQISEGAATSLVYALGGNYFTPAAASALPGVTLTVLARGLARRNLTLKLVSTSLAQMRGAQALWLVNSLMGIMPVASWDGEPMRQEGDTAFIQEILRSEAGKG
jgi:branched-chain amino acid aminotransferase/para-aminobenzoate synthetase component 1